MDSIDHELLTEPVLSTMEICRACGITIQKFRYWESVCPTLKPCGHRHRRPVYDHSALQTALEIRKLLAEGLKMPAVSKRLQQQASPNRQSVLTTLHMSLHLSEARRRLEEVLHTLQS